MNCNNHNLKEEVLEALSFSTSEIRVYLREKNVEGMKIFLRGFDSSDLNVLTDIAISYEQYEVCQAVKDVLKERTINN